MFGADHGIGAGITAAAGAGKGIDKAIGITLQVGDAVQFSGRQARQGSHDAGAKAAAFILVHHFDDEIGIAVVQRNGMPGQRLQACQVRRDSRSIRCAFIRRHRRAKAQGDPHRIIPSAQAAGCFGLHRACGAVAVFIKQRHTDKVFRQHAVGIRRIDPATICPHQAL